MTSLFRFRKFDVLQDKNAMKIGTDSVILGSLISLENIETVLDVGAGTGVLSLMVAQRCDAHITAIEMDPDGADECEDNFMRSPWTDRLECIATSFQSFDTEKRFDLIISNPPYFLDSFPSPNPQRQLARHKDLLPAKLLLNKSASLLSGRGKLSIIIPFDQRDAMESFATGVDLFCNAAYTIFGKENGPPKRIVLEFSRENGACEEQELIVEKERRHEYTRPYLDLMRDYLFLE